MTEFESNIILLYKFWLAKKYHKSSNWSREYYWNVSFDIYANYPEVSVRTILEQYKKLFTGI